MLRYTNVPHCMITSSPIELSIVRDIESPIGLDHTLQVQGRIRGIIVHSTF